MPIVYDWIVAKIVGEENGKTKIQISYYGENCNNGHPIGEETLYYVPENHPATMEAMGGGGVREFTHGVGWLEGSGHSTLEFPTRDVLLAIQKCEGLKPELSSYLKRNILDDVSRARSLHPFTGQQGLVPTGTLYKRDATHMEKPTKSGFYWAIPGIYGMNEIQPVEFFSGGFNYPDGTVHLIGQRQVFDAGEIREWIAECVPPTNLEGK